MSKPVKFQVGSAGNGWQVIGEECPVNFDSLLQERANEFTGRVLNKRLAEIAQLPQYSKVVALEDRRTEACREIERLRAEIAKAKDTCIGDTVADAKTIAAATDRIMDCEKQITAAELAIESVDRILPDAHGVRERVVRERSRELMAQERERLQGEFEALAQKAWKAWKDVVTELLVLDRCIAHASGMENTAIGVPTIASIVSGK